MNHLVAILNWKVSSSPPASKGYWLVVNSGAVSKPPAEEIASKSPGLLSESGCDEGGVSGGGDPVTRPRMAAPNDTKACRSQSNDHISPFNAEILCLGHLSLPVLLDKSTN